MVAASFPDPDPRDVDAELRALRAARSVVTASEWAKGELISRGAAPDAVIVAVPGSDAAATATGTWTGAALLCVGAVAPHKGQDMLVEALTRLPAGVRWTCTFAGSTAVDSSFARAVAERAAGAGLASRITWAGVLGPRSLGDAYSAADLVVAPSRAESYGIAIGDALSRGIPVIASRVGGIPEAVAPGGGALLVPPGDPAALADALRGWMADPELRRRLTDRARREAPTRPRWHDTARVVDAALRGAS
nr:glycosyltransferase family 4 protein [Microbacterium sp. MF43]